MRLHRPDALSLARAELAACLSVNTLADAGTAASGSKRDAGAGDGPAAVASAEPVADGGSGAWVSRSDFCDRGRLSLLVGYLALSDGDAAGALAQLSSTPPPRELSAIHAYYLGEAQFYTRDPASAARSFARALKTAPAWLASRLRARLGESYLAAGNPAQAAPLLEKAALEGATPELYWQRAAARRAVGNLDGERADLKTLALRFPAHPYGAAALERLAGSGKKVLLTFDERLTRARGFLEAGDAASGLAELQVVEAQKLARGASALARLALTRAGARFAVGDEAGADRDLEVAAKGQPPIAADALMMRARRLLRADDNPAARALMAEVDRRFPNEAVATDAGYLAAWLDLQGGRYADSVAAFEAFDKKHHASKKRDEAFWFRALALVRLNRFGDASTALGELQAAFPRSALVPQARYWAARSQQLALKPGVAAGPVAALFEGLVAAFPGSFYAQLSIERLRELGRVPPRLFSQAPRQLVAKVPAELSLAVALAETGLFRDAAEEALSRIAAVHTPDQALKYGHALQSLGSFGDAHALAARLLWGPAYGARLPEALALLYPRAYEGAVGREAKARSLDPYLVWAVMRRESAFRSEVVSAANARGLLQIIPPTAKAIAREMGSAEPDPDSLYSPELNIKLSAWYLAALVDRFAGNPALAAAAYNAGPNAVARWARAKPDAPLDLWIEEIPYKETRGYVKQVVADLFVYHSLYDGKAAEPPRLQLTVPSPADGGVNF